MKINFLPASFAAVAAAAFCANPAIARADAPRLEEVLRMSSTPPAAQLPGELSAAQILDGVYPFPPSPSPGEIHDDSAGLARERLGTVPAPGVHPRLLISPDQLPDLRRRLHDTEAGRALTQTLHQRIADAIGKPNTYGHDLAELLSSGNLDGATRLVTEHKGLPPTIGHYQFYLYSFVLQAFEALINEDETEGRRAATAIATYARLVEPLLDSADKQPMAGDISRSLVGSDVPWGAGSSPRELVGYHLLGYGYDFAYGFMTNEQRNTTRHVIAKATNGKVWLGANLPHHWRNWNWVAIGLSQPLLALSIEGEEGYDPRVYRLGVQIAHDFLSYALSPSGSSTEAVGYTQFGLVWGNPFFVAATRRGDNLLGHSHHRAMLNWYIHSTEPHAPFWKASGETHGTDRNMPPLWGSHGDGGDSGPEIWTLSMWHYFFPNDARAGFLWQVAASTPNYFDGNFHLIEPMLWATDNAPADAATSAALNFATTFFDPVRSSLNARSDWKSANAAALQFECRTDSVGGSHEHADRGSFTFSALGRQWARDGFRAVETRHHSNILIDGLGQGYWPGPGQWLGLRDGGWALLAACDTKPAYDWWWPKQIITEPTDNPRFAYSRWASYKTLAEDFRKTYGAGPFERDPRPSVKAFFTGFSDIAGGPRMWDEDTWPVRLPHNPVERAFRTVAFVKGDHPYLLIVDDIQKDRTERLYEWLMMTGPNTEMASFKNDDVVLCDATVGRNAVGMPQPKRGERELLVRVLEAGTPSKEHDLQARPSLRLEAFDKHDTITSFTRSYGIDKRLVVASRAVAPQFKILLFPHREGEPLPETVWNADRTHLTIKLPNGTLDEITFNHAADGRTHLTLSRPGQAPVALP